MGRWDKMETRVLARGEKETERNELEGLKEKS